MASTALDQATDPYALDAPRAPLLAPNERSYGWWNRTVHYVPRFVRHFRRRVKSGMTMRSAWRSARLRMHDYR